MTKKRTRRRRSRPGRPYHDRDVRSLPPAGGGGDAESRPADKLRVCWATDYYGIGNSYGYSVHNQKTREALQAAGVRFDEGADIAVHVGPAHLFKPLSGRFNILYTAWEMKVLPPLYVEKLALADLVVVSASYLVDVVRRYLPDKPVRLCWEGVDTETFWFLRRRKPLGKPFRFLWVGAPNARKGWELVVDAWTPFRDDKRFELYVKTTVTDRLVRRGNVTFDSRRLHFDDYVALYHAAHCFVFPSFGEGFGLTMAEAMSTGLPVAYTPWSSMLDLAPPEGMYGFPLRYRMVDLQVQDTGGLLPVGGTPTQRAVPARLAQADTGHLAETMARVWRRYGQALKRAERAAARVRGRFTWKHTGARLRDIIQEARGSWLQAATCAH